MERFSVSGFAPHRRCLIWIGRCSSLVRKRFILNQTPLALAGGVFRGVYFVCQKNREPNLAKFTTCWLVEFSPQYQDSPYTQQSRTTRKSDPYPHLAESWLRLRFVDMLYTEGLLTAAGIETPEVTKLTHYLNNPLLSSLLKLLQMKVSEQWTQGNSWPF